MKRFHKVIAENRRAYFEYNILDKYEAGITLQGAEVKSVRAGNVSIKEGYGMAARGEVFLHNMYIAPYKFEARASFEPRRTRKLLLKESEIKRITGKVSQKGLTLIPLKVVLSGDWVKVEVGVAQPKKVYEKKEKIKAKTAKKEMERALLEKRKKGW